MNDAARKVLESALDGAKERISYHQREVDTLEAALDSARLTKANDEETITELESALSEEDAPEQEEGEP